MRTILSAAFFAAVVGASVADEPKKADDKPAAKTADEKALTTKEKVKALKEEFEKAGDKLKKEFGDAKTAEEKNKIRKSFFDLQKETAKKAFELAKNFSKDDGAFDALEMAIQMSGGDQKLMKKASDLLLSDFIDNPKLVKMLPMIARGNGGDVLLATVAEKSKDKSVQAAAKYFAIAGKIEKIDQPDGKALPLKEATAKYDEISRQLADLVAQHGDLKVETDEGETTIAKASVKTKFFLENLVVGRKAPDVECELLDGKKAKLSDYQGKVVVLDIWATWCGPCRGMIPHERELVAKLKDKKFTFISVSADKKKATLEKFLEKEEMPWTHWWDGGANAVTEKFQVQFFPTIYVLDAKGVIRFKHVREKAMDEAVESLLKELDGAQ